MQTFRCCKQAFIFVLAGCSLISCSHGATDFNEVGKQMSILLQNVHYSRKEFSDQLSQKFLDSYLRQLDPFNLYFTKQDVQAIQDKYGDELDEYLMSGKIMDAARVIHGFSRERAYSRLNLARQLLKENNFSFDRKAYIERSRKKKTDWPTDEAAMQQLWRDMVEEQLLSEILRRETIAKLAQEKGQPNPLADEKPPQEKLLMRFDRMQRALQEEDMEAVAEKVLNAVATTYDMHTNYMGNRTMERFKSSMSNELTGIGALLGAEDDGSVKINGIVVGGPADKSGELKLNDRILAVDTDNSGNFIDILFMQLDKVVELVRGKENTQLRLKVESADTPGQARIVTLTRSKVALKDELAKGEIVEINGAPQEQDRIGIINLPSFYADMEGGERRCAADVKKILDRMQNEHVDALIIDLRNNGGGSLEEVRNMAGFFIGEGPVVQIKNTRGEVRVHRTDVRKDPFKGPIVVLTNKLSASASEILAAALQDYGRALIVGDTTTFGKGTVQQPVDVGVYLPFFADRSKAGMLKVTTQKFYRIAGGSTQHKGVESDIQLPTTTAALEIGERFEDNVLPYDEISAVRRYKKNSAISTMLPYLKDASAKRVAADRDFQIMKEDIEMVKKRIHDNKISLNRKERVAENQKLQQRTKDLNAERKERFERISKQDAQNYTIYRLTLDDLGAKQLPKANPEKDDEQFMHIAKDPTEELTESLTYPSGLDPELRESINIARDMLRLLSDSDKNKS